MTFESPKRNVISENDPATRNPFGVMDVPNPNDDDVTQFARNTVPEESATGDKNYERGTIEGEWLCTTATTSGRAA